jgi:hypothetical protein
LKEKDVKVDVLKNGVAHFGNLLGFGRQRRSPPQGVFVKILEGGITFSIT